MFIKRRELSKKERKRLSSVATNDFPDIFPNAIPDNLVEVECKNFLGYLDQNKQLVLIKKKKQLFPPLQLLQSKSAQFSFVTVDDGAISHILNGANVFAAGIVNHSSFKKGEVILVNNLKGTTIALGLAALDSEKLERDQKDVGMVVSSLHHLHDEIWNFQG
ncbi:MAG: PUA domain-containing protein [Candidatus Hodarchaeales archaeon]